MLRESKGRRKTTLKQKKKKVIKTKKISLNIIEKTQKLLFKQFNFFCHIFIAFGLPINELLQK